MKENNIIENEIKEQNYLYDERYSGIEEIKGFKNEPEEIKIERVKDNFKKYDKSIKIILIGDSKVGKTSILHRLTDNKFNEKYEPSLSLEYTNYTIKINNYIIRMQIWDTSGQEKYDPDSIISNYYKTAEVTIFVYAINDLSSFDNLDNYLNGLIYENIEKNNTKTVLLGNKTDLGEERKIDIKTAKNFSKNHKFDFFYEITCKKDDSKNINSITNIFNSIGKLFYEESSRLSISSNLEYSAPESLIESKNQELERDNDEFKKKCCFCIIF